MNKLLIVLLAVCLISVSVQAFAKREAPATNQNQLEDLQKQFKEFTDNIGKQIKENVDFDKLQAQFNTAAENVKKAFDDLTKTPTKQ